MIALDMLEKLHADLIRQRCEVDADLKRLADAYHTKLVERMGLSVLKTR